jgi:hypothetical protein
VTLSSGSRVGPYEILGPLGAGGMGEVYRARDTRLGREVAIKVLPAALGSDSERLKRFEREARSASSLNHPNIVTIYDIGTADSVSYIAMELVGGEPLRALMLEGPLPVRRLLQIAVQVADGLAKAHIAAAGLLLEEPPRGTRAEAARRSRRRSRVPRRKSFDVSPDGKQILFDRYRENSDVVLIDLPPR